MFTPANDELSRPSAQVTAPPFPPQELKSDCWSPGAFSHLPVPGNILEALFASAHWSASSCIEQPWTYLVASQDEPAEFARLHSCLSPAHQSWASHAPVLVLSVINQSYAKNEETHLANLLDLGLATAHLAIVAHARGLAVHQILGIRPERARALYRIPPHSGAWTVLAIGHR